MQNELESVLVTKALLHKCMELFWVFESLFGIANPI